MSRVPLHTFESVSAAARPILAHVVEASPGIGAVLDLWAAMADSPTTLAAYMSLRDAITTHATLDPKTRSAIAMTAGSAIGGAYSQAINSRSAQRAGWTAEETFAIRAGTGLEPKLDALLVVVREATANEGRVEDATWARAKALGWADPELVEAFTYIVLVIFVDFFAHFVEVEPEVPPLAAAATANGAVA